MRFAELAALAKKGEITTPSGDVVCPSRLRSLGHLLGASGGAEKLHYLLEYSHTSRAFRHDLAELLPYGGRNPLYAVIHESSYADGVVTDWSAARMLPDDFREDPTLLTGEHVMPEWFDTDQELRPWKEVANLMANHPWPKLYDPDVLRTAAAVYHDDAYVPRKFSLETAALLPQMHAWVTTEYEHNGSNASGGAVLDRLIKLAKGEIVR